MRDILVSVIIFGAIPFIMTRTYVGILMWSWISYMNPHRMAYGFAYSFPFAQVIAIATLLSLLFNKEKKKFIVDPLTIFWVLFILWITITCFFALNPMAVWWEWERAVKIQLFSIITVLVVTNKQRINALVMIIVFSLGFFGVKGGLFSLLTGGEYRVYGPPQSFIADNNALALALVMILPFMRYLQLETRNTYIKIGLSMAMGLTALSIFTSYSRGALLAIISMVFVLWLRSKNKLKVTLVLIVLAPVLLNIMPDKWFSRMDTIETYKQDSSALGRINAWHFAFNLASDYPVTGGGFQITTKELYLIYAPDPRVLHAAHSIYFEVLGEHGFVGLFIFLMVGIFALKSSSSIIKQTRDQPELSWVNNLASMLQVSLVGYSIGGAFLNLAYYDLYWHIIALVVILKIYIRDFTSKDIQLSY